MVTLPEAKRDHPLPVTIDDLIAEQRMPDGYGKQEVDAEKHNEMIHVEPPVNYNAIMHNKKWFG